MAAEAKAKRDLDIEPGELQGMTAKEIPTQSNFSDCGLFVCVYLEQFVADPYNFIRRILQRDPSAQQWPRRIHSEDLRSRLRELILEMHRRQENEPSKMEEPVIGSILIDKRELSPTPPPIIEKRQPPSSTAGQQTAKQEIEKARKRFDKLTDVQCDTKAPVNGHTTIRSNPLAAAQETLDATRLIPNSQDGHDYEDGKDMVIDEKRSRAKLRQPTKSPFISESPPPQPVAPTPTVEVGVSPPRSQKHPLIRSRAHSQPGELAKLIRKERTEHDFNKRRRLTQNGDSAEERDSSRSPSRSSQLTHELLSAEQQYLTGIEEYAAQPSSVPESLTGTVGKHKPLSRSRPVVDRVEESTSPSPESEIVVERQITTPKQAPNVRKRKWTPPMKLQAPETAEDVVKGEFNGFADLTEAEVLESQEFGPRREHVERGRSHKKRARDHASDGEMLLSWL